MAIKTVNNQLAVMSTLIKYVTGVKSRLRFKLEGMAAAPPVASADVEKLLEKCEDKRYEAVILLASEAGLRAAEIRGLQWNDIKAEQITVRRSLDKMTNEAVAPKHNKSRTIPMSKRLAASLVSLPRRSLWVVSEPDCSCVPYDRMLETVHAIDRSRRCRAPAEGSALLAAHVRHGDGSEGSASCTSEANGSLGRADDASLRRRERRR